MFPSGLAGSARISYGELEEICDCDLDEVRSQESLPAKYSRDRDKGTSCRDYFNILDHKLCIETIVSIETIDAPDTQTNDAWDNNNQTPVDFIHQTIFCFTQIDRLIL